MYVGGGGSQYEALVGIDNFLSVGSINGYIEKMSQYEALVGIDNFLSVGSINGYIEKMGGLLE